MNAIAGIGLDIIDLNHFKLHYGDFDPDLLKRCFSDAELADTQSGCDRLARLAARFAAKEAAFKAVGGLEGCALCEIEIASNEHGQPHIILHGNAKAAAKAEGITSFLVSLTHSGASAAAVVIALSVTS
jgi:holo-[acyl-carrier protein] synthase